MRNLIFAKPTLLLIIISGTVVNFIVINWHTTKSSHTWLWRSHKWIALFCLSLHKSIFIHRGILERNTARQMIYGNVISHHMTFVFYGNVIPRLVNTFCWHLIIVKTEHIRTNPVRWQFVIGRFTMIVEWCTKKSDHNSIAYISRTDECLILSFTLEVLHKQV